MPKKRPPSDNLLTEIKTTWLRRPDLSADPGWKVPEAALAVVRGLLASSAPAPEASQQPESSAQPFQDSQGDADREPPAWQSSLQITASGNLQVLKVSRDAAELHLLVRKPSDRRSFGFLALRQVQFLDQQQTVSWCLNSACSKPTGHGCVFQDTHFGDTTAEERLQGEQPLCPCARQVLAAHPRGWLDAALQAHSRSTSFDPDNPIVPLQAQGCIAVLAGGTLEEWGVVEISNTAAKCLTCSRHKQHCPHTRVWRDSCDSSSSDQTAAGVQRNPANSSV